MDASKLFLLDFALTYAIVAVQSLSRVWLFAHHESPHTRLPCPSPAPGACSNSCPSSRWCHPTISSSVTPFSSCLPSFPASGSFPMSHLFKSGGQSTRASASVLPVNIVLISFRIDWFDLAVQGTLKAQFFWFPDLRNHLLISQGTWVADSFLKILSWFTILLYTLPRLKHLWNSLWCWNNRKDHSKTQGPEDTQQYHFTSLAGAVCGNMGRNIKSWQADWKTPTSPKS